MQSGPVRQAIELLHQQWQQPPSLQALADAVALSPCHLHRALSAALGEPVGQYCLRSRIAGAAYLLGDAGLSITEVALAVGYDTPAAFTAAFRSRAGQTPQQWRQQLWRQPQWLAGLSAQPERVAEPQQQIWVRQFRGWSAVMRGIERWQPPLLIRYDQPPFTAAEQCRFDLGHWPGQLPIAGSHALTLAASRVALFAARLPLAQADLAVGLAIHHCRSQGWATSLIPTAVLLHYCAGEPWVSGVRVALAA